MLQAGIERTMNCPIGNISISHRHEPIKGLMSPLIKSSIEDNPNPKIVLYETTCENKKTPKGANMKPPIGGFLSGRLC
jgi:hypothetical protein